MSNAEKLIAVLATVFEPGETEVDEQVVERMIAALDEITAPDVEVLMTGPDEAFTARFTGRDGLRAGWTDWLEAFGKVRFEVEGVEEVGKNVITLGRQVTTTRHGVELEQPSAAVFKFDEGVIWRVEFHLDREKAAASAAER